MTAPDAMRYQKTRKFAFTRESWGVLAVLVLIVVLTAVPYFITDDLYRGHDGFFHIFRIEGLAQSMSEGIFPTRMQYSQIRGLGYPVSIFYGDVFLYPAAIMRLMGISPMVAFKATMVFLSALSVALAYVSFRSISQSRSIGLIVTILWMFAPYHLLCSWLRSALGEVSAMAFFPVVVLGIYWLFISREEKKPFTGVVLGLAAAFILTSHIISTFLVLVFALPFLVCAFIFGDARYCLKHILFAALLAILLSLWYLVPFFDSYLSQSLYVNDGSMVKSTGGHMANQAVFPSELFAGIPPFFGWSVPLGVDDNRMPYNFGWPMLFFAVVLIVLFIIPRTRRAISTPFRVVAVVSLVEIGIAAFMTTTRFPWEAVETNGLLFWARPFFLLQFPWRLLGPITILFTVLVLSVLMTLERSVSPLPRRIIIAIPLLWLVVWFGVSLTTHLDNSIRVTDGDIEQRLSQKRTNDLGSGEYLMSGVPLEFLLEEPYIADALVVADEGVEAKITKSGGSQLVLSVKATDEDGGWLSVPAFAYKYVTAEDESGGVLKTEKGENSLLCIEIPAGFDGSVTVAFHEPLFWKVATAVSLVTAVALVIGMLLMRRKIEKDYYREALHSKIRTRQTAH